MFHNISEFGDRDSPQGAVATATVSFYCRYHMLHNTLELVIEIVFKAM